MKLGASQGKCGGEVCVLHFQLLKLEAVCCSALLEAGIWSGGTAQSVQISVSKMPPLSNALAQA